MPRAIPAILKFNFASLVVMACLGVALAGLIYADGRTINTYLMLSVVPFEV
jgi:hypothetical protein